MWASDVGGTYDIHYCDGIDLTWPLDSWSCVQVNQDSFIDRMPILSSVLRDTTWVAWESFRDGKWDIMGTAVHVSIGAVEEPPKYVPSRYVLWQNYPNPFNAATMIRYDLPSLSFVTLEIFDLLGHKVRTLVNHVQPLGQHKIIWDGRNDKGYPLTSGLHFCRLQAGKVVKVIKLLLQK